MRKKLTNNLGLKLLALFVSTALWFISININDPVSQDSYNVRVQLKNTNSMTSAGKYLEVVDDSDYIKVNVRGTRTALSAFSADNIIATADIDEMVGEDKVPIKLTTTKLSDKIESIKSDREYVTIRTENIEKHQFPIAVSVQNEPAEGYILGQTSTNQNIVIVSGPKSVVDQVVRAEVEINVDNVNSDVNVSLPIRLYDADDKVVDAGKLTMSINEVTTNASILQTKSLPISCVVKGTVLDGYVLGEDVLCTPSEVTVAGKPGILKNIDSVVIKDAVDITGNDRNIVAHAKLTDYLPDGVTVMGDEVSSDVEIEVSIQKESEVEITIPLERVHFVNVPEEDNLEIDDEEDIVLTVYGQKDLVNSLKSTDVAVMIDVEAYMDKQEINELKKGTVYMPLTVTLPDKLHLNKTYRVKVDITKE
ncbi:MAG: hypothetical protein K5662_08245 [Lachnospiraceae bacterium]|nr:hypothetical protein [Lachnospiraceae bacterium]